MDYLILIIDETQKLGDEWRKAMKKYGMQDERTQMAYYKYLGADKIRTCCMELADNKEGDVYGD